MRMTSSSPQPVTWIITLSSPSLIAPLSAVPLYPQCCTMGLQCHLWCSASWLTAAMQRSVGRQEEELQRGGMHQRRKEYPLMQLGSLGRYTLNQSQSFSIWQKKCWDYVFILLHTCQIQKPFKLLACNVIFNNIVIDSLILTLKDITSHWTIEIMVLLLHLSTQRDVRGRSELITVTLELLLKIKWELRIGSYSVPPPSF